MRRARRRGAVTWAALLVIIVVIFFLICLLLPATSSVREAARRSDCINKTKQHTLALHNYHDAQGGFPPTAVSIKGTATPNLDGYSFWLDLLPGLEHKPAYDQIKQAEKDANATKDPFKNPIASRFRSGMFTCPNYTGPRWQDERNEKFAIINYKAMSATHKESLACAADPNAVPKYGDHKQHPDGGLVPLTSLRLRQDFSDGTSNTMFIVETVDSTGSYWAAGKTISLVGLPSTVDYVQASGVSYWAPAGFVAGKYDSEARYDNPATYFNWNYAGKGTNAGPYDTDLNITHGPSSAHPSVINCGFGDGNARSVSKDIDPALLMFLITRAGTDPSSEYFARAGGG